MKKYSSGSIQGAIKNTVKAHSKMFLKMPGIPFKWRKKSFWVSHLASGSAREGSLMDLDLWMPLAPPPPDPQPSGFNPPHLQQLLWMLCLISKSLPRMYDEDGKAARNYGEYCNCFRLGLTIIASTAYIASNHFLPIVALELYAITPVYCQKL